MMITNRIKTTSGTDYPDDEDFIDEYGLGSGEQPIHEQELLNQTI